MNPIILLVAYVLDFLFVVLFLTNLQRPVPMRLSLRVFNSLLFLNAIFFFVWRINVMMIYGSDFSCWFH